MVPSDPTWSSVDPGLRVRELMGGGGGTLLWSRRDFLSVFYPIWLSLPQAFLSCHRSPLGFQGFPDYWL